jgi:S-adenosylmethionine synthetase
MMRRYIFSSESVTEGHPDKVCDTISDRILDACLTQDPDSQVACETLAKGNLVVIAGEITTNARFDYLTKVRSAVREIGYVHEGSLFHADTCVIRSSLEPSVTRHCAGRGCQGCGGKGKPMTGAGDQGLMFGFAVTKHRS